VFNPDNEDKTEDKKHKKILYRQNVTKTLSINCLAKIVMPHMLDKRRGNLTQE